MRNNSYLSKGNYYWHFAMPKKYIHPYIWKIFKKIYLFKKRRKTIATNLCFLF